MDGFDTASCGSLLATGPHPVVACHLDHTAIRTTSADLSPRLYFSLKFLWGTLWWIRVSRLKSISLSFARFIAVFCARTKCWPRNLCNLRNKWRRAHLPCQGHTYFFSFASGVDVSLPLRRLSPRHAPSDIKGCFTSKQWTIGYGWPWSTNENVEWALISRSHY